MTRSFLFFVLFFSQSLFLKASIDNAFGSKTFGSTILSITDIYKKPILEGSTQEVAAAANTITYYITSSSTDTPKFTYAFVSAQGNPNETWYTVTTTATTLKVTFTANAHYLSRYLTLSITSGDAAQTLIIKQKAGIDLILTTPITVSPSAIVNQGTEITFKGTIKNTGTLTYNKYIRFVIMDNNNVIQFFSVPIKISIGAGSSYIASFKYPTQYAIPGTYQVMFAISISGEPSSIIDRTINHPTTQTNFTINPYCATPKITATSAYDAIKNTVVTKFTWERFMNSFDNSNAFYIRKKGTTDWLIYQNIDGTQGLTFESNAPLQNGTAYEYYLWTNCSTLGTSNTSTIATITTAKSKSFDLQLVSITPTPTIATVGKSMSIKVVVKNNGLGALSGATFKIFASDGIPLGSQKTNVNISAGYTSTMYFTMTAFPNLNSSSYRITANYILNNTAFYLGDSNVYQVISSTTGLAEAEGLSPNTLIKQQNALNIYPNPASNNLNIDLVNDSKSDNLKIELYDISGKKVLENEVFSIEGLNHYNLDISNMERGLYVLRILGKELSITEKLSIEK